MKRLSSETPAVRDARRCEHRERRSPLAARGAAAARVAAISRRRRPAGARAIEGLRGDRPERDLRHLQPVEGLAAEARLGAQQRAALRVDGELDVVRARPRAGTRTAVAPSEPLRGTPARSAPRGARDLDLAGGLEPLGADERDRVEEEAVRRRAAAPPLLLASRPSRRPSRRPRRPTARRPAPDVALPGLHARRLLPVPRRALEREARRRARLVGCDSSAAALADRRRHPTCRAVPLCHVAGRTRRRSAARGVHSTTVRRAGRARSPASWSSSRISPSAPMSRFCPRPVCVCSPTPARGDRPATTHRRWRHLVSDLLATPLDDLMAEARRLRAQGTGHARHVFAEGLRPADDALPRRLRLLHVRAAAAARRARLPDRGRGARDRPRRGGRLAAPRRSSRSATGPRPATASRGRSSQRSGARRRSSTSPAARGCVLDETGLLPHLNPGVMSRDELASLRPVAASMGIMLETTAGAARRARRPALGLARQGAGAPARDDAPRGRARDPVHERDPDRDRRDAGGADRRARSRCVRSPTSTGTCAR